ncbi:FecR domain-containing protein [Polyangium jinanense]|uniref:FecR domain-containing protein n=1 Tax=Polyangium jinanense TaxID=2829994 RepID=A0A9X4AXB6_9BACT|nr:FecR domain-containing protein [Polyangium jinanense]MDC3961728.1 FecR domain-containing protein [Polyangium jinanense]MDC3988234.1 FecR domain-containing protein [Polyangium jinanense]
MARERYPMGQSERSLTNLGQQVATLQDRHPAARLERTQGRARLLEATIPRTSRRPRSLAVGLALLPAAALLVIVLMASVATRPRASLRFSVGMTEPGAVGAWIAAPKAAELPIRFSDGSELHLAPGGRARVTAIDAHGAEIAVERGTLDLSIVHLDRARWTVWAGPFQVHVIGTRFEIRWDPATEQVSVGLREGAITISGPVVGDERAVRAGERLTISPAQNTLEVGTVDESAAPVPTAVVPTEPPKDAVPPIPDAPSTSPTARVTVAESPRPHARANASGSSVPPPVVAPAGPGWRALSLEAKYKDALAAAELEGFDVICEGASASDLRALGDAARLGGSAARASQAFTSLRSRFPGSPEAAAAAFILGRIAQDQRKDHAGAAGWFVLYLQEQPGGAFAAEAAGRLVEAEDKRGDLAGARRAAERYLAAYPSGVHAAYARGVLARGASSAP